MTNIKLPISQIKEFLSLSKYIKTDDSVLTVLKYIKIEIEFGFCFLVKSNNNSFCKYVFETSQEDCSFLIPEDKLLVLCEFGKSDYVEIKIEEDIMNISSGKWKQEVNLSGANINEFPRIPETNNERLLISGDVLDSLKSAKVHAGKDKLVEFFTAIYMSGYRIFSSNGSCGYNKTFINQLPSVGLSQMECDMLSSFDEIFYSKCDNYNTYKIKDVVYGFIQPEGYKPFDMDFVLSKIKKETHIEINREEWLAFCDSTIKFSKDVFCRALFVCLGDGKGKLYFDDRSKKEKNEIEIDISVSGEPFNFTFQPEMWSLVLKSLEYEKICIGNEGACFSIFNLQDESYLGFIQKIKEM